METLILPLCFNVLIIFIGTCVLKVFFKSGKLDIIETITLSIPCFFILVLCFQLLNFCFFGKLFSSPFLLVVLLSVLLGCIYLRNPGGVFRVGIHKIDLYTLSLLGIILLTVAIHTLPFTVTKGRFPLFGDIIFHMYHANQITLGYSSPEHYYSNPLGVHIPTYYPWFFHAFLAFIKQCFFLNIIDAYKTITLTQIILLPLSVFTLARYLTQKVAIALLASFFTSLSGGLGWIKMFYHIIFTEGFKYVIPYYDVYKSDTFVQTTLGGLLDGLSPNSSLINIAPTYPRELALVLYVICLYLFLRGIKEQCKSSLLVCGILSGILGLLHVHTFVSIVSSFALVIVFFCFKRANVKALFITFCLIVSLALLFYIPLVIHYFEYGGIVNPTRMKEIFLPLPYVLCAWGLVSPFCVYGLWLWVRKKITMSLPWPVIAIAFLPPLGIAGTRIFVALVSDRTFDTVFRIHRWWFITYIFFSILAATGVYDLYTRFAFLRNKLYVFLLLLSGIVSPLVNAAMVSHHTRHLFWTEEFYNENRLLNKVQNYLKNDSVVLASNADISVYISALTGARTMFIRNPHIRWKDIHRQFVPQEERAKDVDIFFKQDSSSVKEKEILDKYNVTHVILREDEWRDKSEIKSLRLLDQGMYSGEMYYIVTVVQ